LPLSLKKRRKPHSQLTSSRSRQITKTKHQCTSKQAKLTQHIERFLTFDTQNENGPFDLTTFYIDNLSLQTPEKNAELLTQKPQPDTTLDNSFANTREDN